MAHVKKTKIEEKVETRPQSKEVLQARAGAECQRKQRSRAGGQATQAGGR